VDLSKVRKVKYMEKEMKLLPQFTSFTENQIYYYILWLHFTYKQAVKHVIKLQEIDVLKSEKIC
jgi:hypothetical protein